jgi:hypothetical protein
MPTVNRTWLSMDCTTKTRGLAWNHVFFSSVDPSLFCSSLASPVHSSLLHGNYLCARPAKECAHGSSEQPVSKLIKFCRAKKLIDTNTTGSIAIINVIINTMVNNGQGMQPGVR